MREKWAGANSNRGYGHPKAEGYQATPPARMHPMACSGVKGYHLPALTGRRSDDVALLGLLQQVLL